MQFNDAVVRQSKSAFVLARLRESIFAGEFEQGEVMRQNELAARFGVSSTPVREALRGLQAEGLVTMSPRGGATVARFGEDRVDELHELRALVEGYATRLAAENLRMRRAEEIDRLHQLIVHQAGADLWEPRVLQELDRRFHFMIYETGALIVATTARSLWSYLPTYDTEWTNLTAAGRLIAEHAGILAALRAADPDLAESRMRAHILFALGSDTADRTVND